MRNWPLESEFSWNYRNREDHGFDDKWANPLHTKEKSSHPYSYSEFFIFGNRRVIKDVHGDYSDRLWEWDHDKADKLWKKHVKTRWEFATKAQLTAFISEYHGKTLKVVALAEGCNPSNGYPYWILWYVEGK